MGIRQQTIDDYGSFVEKFKPKKTTDDCYTPPRSVWGDKRLGLLGIRYRP